VALKVIHKHLSGNEKHVRERFLQEAKILDQLDHPNILAIKDCFEERGRLVIATELLQGRTLAAVLRNDPSLPHEVKRDYLIQILEGVAYAHDRDIIHRDLKLTNIFITEDNIVQLLDFGLGKQLGVGQILTRTGVKLGTPIYMPPETLRAKRQVKVRDVGKEGDIFAIGVIAYRLFTGRLPYDISEGANAVSAMTELAVHYSAGDPIEPVGALCRDLSPSTADAIMACLSLSPQARPGIRDVLHRVTGVYSAVSKDDSPAGARQVTTPNEGSKKRLKRLLGAGLVLLAAALACLLIFEMGGAEPPHNVSATDHAQASVETGGGSDQETREKADCRPSPTGKGGTMCLVPGGPFLMGCNEAVDQDCAADEKPSHRVNLAGYYLDQHEVTVSDYRDCVVAKQCSEKGLTVPSRDGAADRAWAHACNWDKPGREDYPVNCLPWAYASRYCRWVGKRLPTEAEWEKGARGTKGWKYPWDHRRGFEGGIKTANIADVTTKTRHPQVPWTTAPGYDDGFAETAVVAHYPKGKSPYGLYDMVGNVAEWVADSYAPDYHEPEDAPERPNSPESDEYRVVRGGGFHDSPKRARASYRGKDDPKRQDANIGFRCAVDAEPR
jgi:formylglycine-generating enzyme required for sulfatase activity